MPPLSYAFECGPTALAAVMHIDRHDAARMLWGHRSPPPRARCGPAGRGSWGTWPLDIASVLIRCGWRVELYDGAGRLWLDADAFPAFLANRAHREAGEIRRVPPESRRERSRYRRERNYATPIPRLDPLAPVPLAEQVRALTVARWLRDFQGSTWILFVLGHILAARAGKIIAGGEGYGRHRVTDALRVVPPHHQRGEP